MSDEYDKLFQQDYYKTTTMGDKPNRTGLASTAVDPTDSYASDTGLAMAISFYHVPSGKSIYFKAFITAFNETYNSEWASEAVYGRGDPIYMFKNTSRAISLAFKVPAFSESEAFENLGKAQQLVQFLYPNYENVNEAQTISQSPLVRLKVMNLLADVSEKKKAPTDTPRFPEMIYDEYGSANDATKGLLGAITNVTIEHGLGNQDSGVIEKQANTILPKLLEINLQFNPIHEHPLGWDSNNNFSDGLLFPYGVELYKPESAKFAKKGTWDDEGKSDPGTSDDSSSQQKENSIARHAGALMKAGAQATGIVAKRAAERTAEAFKDAALTVMETIREEDEEWYKD